MENNITPLYRALLRCCEDIIIPVSNHETGSRVAHDVKGSALVLGEDERYYVLSARDAAKMGTRVLYQSIA